MACLQIREAKRGKFAKCGNIDIEWGVEDPEDSEGLYCSPEDFANSRVSACDTKDACPVCLGEPCVALVLY